MDGLFFGGHPSDSVEGMMASVTAILNNDVDGIEFCEEEQLALLTGYITGLGVGMKLHDEDRTDLLSSELFDRVLELSGMLGGIPD